jgi:hypothetical protein
MVEVSAATIVEAKAVVHAMFMVPGDPLKPRFQA